MSKLAKKYTPSLDTLLEALKVSVIFDETAYIHTICPFWPKKKASVQDCAPNNEGLFSMIMRFRRNAREFLYLGNDVLLQKTIRSTRTQKAQGIQIGFLQCHS